ncbi:hypothetical protein [Stenotrophomonas indicatrix]|uniref:hypothetical protein n=1 Tax=Stenotrophomonas indicatrix TaxID=2045451 RepID=UPI00265B5999|nr:hypothetical protein [Stenotrophomonas indicatrix]
MDARGPGGGGGGGVGGGGGGAAAPPPRRNCSQAWPGSTGGWQCRPLASNPANLQPGMAWLY